MRVNHHKCRTGDCCICQVFVVTWSAVWLVTLGFEVTLH